MQFIRYTTNYVAHALFAAIFCCALAFGSDGVSLAEPLVNAADLKGNSIFGDAVPDFYQRDSLHGTFPRGGATLCGPIAVSNSLMWLSRNGFPELVESTGDPHTDQHALIMRLAQNYMPPGPSGTTVENLCRGLKKYLDARGLSGQIEFEGMYSVSPEFRTGRSIPDIERMSYYTAHANPVWLNIGWYTHNPANNSYTKTGAHWVTLIGRGIADGGGHEECLIMHDPDTPGSVRDSVYTQKIETGVLFNGFGSFPWNAAGFQRFRTSANEYGIIGGAVYLTIDSPLHTDQF